MIKKIVLAFAISLLYGCGGSGSDAGSGDQQSNLPDGLPANFIGTYTGTLNLTASAAGLTETDSFPITITVNADNTVRFDGDEPDETFTVAIANDGSFSGSTAISEEPCEGTISLTGSVDGTTASGSVSGDGTCSLNGLTADVELSGDFSATM